LPGPRRFSEGERQNRVALRTLSDVRPSPTPVDLGLCAADLSLKSDITAARTPRSTRRGCRFPERSGSRMSRPRRQLLPVRESAPAGALSRTVRSTP
jgi:hypothetical protein